MQSLNNEYFQFIFHGWTAISDVYFSLSGFILTANLLPILEENKGKLSYFDLITHRSIRMVPMVLGATCLYNLLPLTSSGPVFNEFAHEQIDSCSSFWTNLIFISNWSPMEKVCVPSGWYFSADFQLYLVGPLIIFILYKSHNLGHKVMLIVISSYVIISTIISYLFDLTPVLTKAHFLDHAWVNSLSLYFQKSESYLTEPWLIKLIILQLTATWMRSFRTNCSQRINTLFHFAREF